MTLCPILNACKNFSNEVAIYSDDGIYTYRQLNDLIEQNRRTDQIFYAYQTVPTIAHFFSLLRNSKVALPISLREPYLPQIDFSKVPQGINTLICTSGTMGAPKLAMHGLEEHLYAAQHPHQTLAPDPSDCFLLSLPYNFIGGMSILFRAFSSGASIVIGETHKHRATRVVFVPTQLKRFLALDHRLHFPHLKVVLLGGTLIPKKICDDAFDQGIPLVLSYGLTETSGSFSSARYNKEEGVHVGKPLEGRQLKIDQDQVIWVKGKTLFRGYFDQESPFKEGWFKTGDLGKQGRYGLEILGRRDKVIISGGENISLDDLEMEFLKIPEVASASLTWRPCEEFGARPVAHLFLSAPIKIEAIREILEKQLPRFKVPNYSDIHVN